MSLFVRLLCISCLLLASATPAFGGVGPETRWFVLEEDVTEYGDSYLLPLSDPVAIAQARARIAQGAASGVGSIVSAQIAAGSDGFNRDVNAPGQPLWSWHVTEFEGFADLAIELCDGWPGFVEQDPAAFIANTSGRICFWNYRIVAELASPPAFAISDALAGAWFNAQTPGQGFFVDVLKETDQLFVGWFTYEGGGATSRPRWYTAQGPITGARADLVVNATTGGAFNAPDPVQTTPVGTLRIDFASCVDASAQFTLNGQSGTIPLQRIAPNANCR